MNRYQTLFLWGAKQPGREADRSIPSSDKIKNAWIYISLVHVVDSDSFSCAL
jgi:hypothetical protein